MNPSNKTAKTLSVFYVLDFDRCLGRTEKFQQLLEEVITGEQQVVSLEMIRYAHEQVKKTGGSFDTAAYVRQVLKGQGLDVNRIWGRIEARFIEAAQKRDMFEPHAKELLDTLEARHAQYGILTYGGYDWQTTKLKAAGLISIPHTITSYQEKGRTIAGWQQPDGLFRIPDELSPDPPLLVDQIVFIDDKLVSFVGIPEGVVGVRILPANQPVLSRPSQLPPGVTEVKGIAGAIELLFSE